MSGDPKKSRRQSGEPVDTADDHFPNCRRFNPHTQLPSYKSVVGRIRYLTSGGKGVMSSKMAIREVCKEIEINYCNATVYCLELRTIERQLTKVFETFHEGRKRLATGRKDKDGNDPPAVAKYKELLECRENLFDCSTDDVNRKEICKELLGVHMGEMEKIYLEDQKGERKWHTQSQPDPVWYRAAMKTKRLQEKSEENFQDLLEERNHGKTFAQLEQLLADQGELPSASSPENTPVKNAPPTPITQLEVERPVKKKKLFVETDDNENETDNMPDEYKCIRTSQRNIRDEFYLTTANLTG